MGTTLTAYLDSFLFVYFPYIAAGVFLAGLCYRVSRNNSSVQALSSQFLSNDKSIKWGSNLFHYAIIMVFVGHIFGLLAPEALYSWLMTNETKRILAIIMGGLFGSIALLGIVLLMLRRFTNIRVKAKSSFADYFIVILIFFQVVTGLLGTTVTIQSPLESYMNIDHWAQSLFIFLPNSSDYLIDTNIIHKIHIVSGFIILIIFPFTKLMHMVAVPIKNILKSFVVK